MQDYLISELCEQLQFKHLKRYKVKDHIDKQKTARTKTLSFSTWVKINTEIVIIQNSRFTKIQQRQCSHNSLVQVTQEHIRYDWFLGITSPASSIPLNSDKQISLVIKTQ